VQVHAGDGGLLLFHVVAHVAFEESFCATHPHRHVRIRHDTGVGVRCIYAKRLRCTCLDFRVRRHTKRANRRSCNEDCKSDLGRTPGFHIVSLLWKNRDRCFLLLRAGSQIRRSRVTDQDY
jgi:hypothetical protein